jgi:hypothetical protein
MFGGSIANAVRIAKFRPDATVAEALGAFWVARAVARMSPPIPDVDAVAFVPAPYRRRVKRGFDLPALLARALAAHKGAGVIDALACARHDEPLSFGADKEQRAKAVISFESEQRQDWHYIPRERKGLPLREMTPGQQHLAAALLAAGLSQQGYVKAVTIMSLEDVLKIMENDDGERRNPQKYYFSIFGTPAETGTWGYRVEGHHISQNYTVVNGRVVGAPSFFGANPAEVREDVSRSGGPGGQGVNKIESAVQLTHLPTGIVVRMREERSQHKNREKAWRLLRTRVFEHFDSKRWAERAGMRKAMIGSGDRSERIRTYNFPQNRCTDHRINENFPLEKIIAGDMTGLIEALQAFDRQERLAALAKG